jgi:hypothetical protein
VSRLLDLLSNILNFPHFFQIGRFNHEFFCAFFRLFRFDIDQIVVSWSFMSHFIPTFDKFSMKTIVFLQLFAISVLRELLHNIIYLFKTVMNLNEKEFICYAIW